MQYDDALEMWKDRLTPEVYQYLLCEEALYDLLQYVEEGIVINERAFMLSIVAFGRRFQNHIRDTMPPAWGEDN